MKKQIQNFLPKPVFKRVALIWKSAKNKLRFPGRFAKLAILSLVLMNFLGYYPAFAIPPVNKAQVFAQSAQGEQKMEIKANSFSKPLRLPHPGYLSTRFSSWHPGIDIASGLGMPVYPVIDGGIASIGRDFFGLGNYVEVIHENGFKSKYAHMGKIYVKKGDQVTSANILGEVGLTGNTSGPHTHLEITLNGKFIDPMGLLPEISDMPLVSVRK